MVLTLTSFCKLLFFTGVRPGEHLSVGYLIDNKSKKYEVGPIYKLKLMRLDAGATQITNQYE